jgi:hypothetical protein
MRAAGLLVARLLRCILHPLAVFFDFFRFFFVERGNLGTSLSMSPQELFELSQPLKIGHTKFT